jgi:hypothetical protein
VNDGNGSASTTTVVLVGLLALALGALGAGAFFVPGRLDLRL